jgi:chaperonin GroES
VRRHDASRRRRGARGPAQDFLHSAMGGHQMTIKPLHDRILVKRVDEETKTKGGIIIPDTAKERPMEGLVIAVGNGKLLENGKVQHLDVKKDDRIIFSKYSGTEVKIEGEEHLILREEDILGILS